jgi:hypothetical protein
MIKTKYQEASGIISKLWCLYYMYLYPLISESNGGSMKYVHKMFWENDADFLNELSNRYILSNELG